MAFVVPTRTGRFEIRESHNTARGPRSKTLASFRELTDDVIETARTKATTPPSAEELRRAARRAGAPVAREPAEEAARKLIAELDKGRRIAPSLRRILIDLLQDGHREAPGRADEAGHAVAAWMAATPAERGNALVDLLLLADALPSGGRKGKPLRFPRLDSGTAP
jgi:hypothetical protein